MNEEGQAFDASPPSRGAMAWLREGARVLALRRPHWQGLEARPLTLASLVLSGYLLVLAVQRAVLMGEPRFVWTGVLQGWMGLGVGAWLCWVATRSGAATGASRLRPSTLLAVSWGAGLVLSLGVSVFMLGLRLVLGPGQEWPEALSWSAWLLPLAWGWLAQSLLLCRVAGTGLARVVVVLGLLVPPVVSGWLAPVSFWWPAPPVGTEAEAEAEPEYGLPLTDETMTRQARLLDAALQAVRPPQRGRVNVYAVTFAPYASEDVFMRESATVAKTMRDRFGADGRLVELVANRATSDTLPWGTPAHLRRTIARMAEVMDRDRDVLFLHLTSHGGRDGKLSTATWPLKTEPLTPELLKRWLDEAGVRWRVISVSACFSGSWIAPLAAEETLVMTAADADHTSYGCGKRSELTFFGRAMYEEALRKTWSFTEAHAFARQVIQVREQEAGKSDGYSNPQISEGAAVRPVLERLANERRMR